jgi:dGTPase
MNKDWTAFEDSWLAPFAMRSVKSRGRKHPEEPHPFRAIFQRDRERIVHCSAFRRLMGKTQVLVGTINDHHRTRLTHTLEVAQISRTIARRLRLNEDLTEAIALSHDLGHPPFGHAGEATLDECIRDQGGFDHNLYGLRRVDELEERYPDFPGLNLSWEVREAFVQHSRRPVPPEWREFREVGGALLEAQVVDAADSVAYDTHDSDDALDIGLISLHDLERVEMWRRVAGQVRKMYPHLGGDPLRRAIIRELIAWQVNDLLAETERRLREGHIQGLEDVRRSTSPLVGFGPELCGLKTELEGYLREVVYRHDQVLRMAHKGQTILRALFAWFAARPELLPQRHLRRWIDAPTALLRGEPSTPAQAHSLPGESLERVVVDYLAGMTDRFAQQEFRRLFQPDGDQ